jgi:hypothetical protein
VVEIVKRMLRIRVEDAKRELIVVTFVSAAHAPGNRRPGFI